VRDRNDQAIRFAKLDERAWHRVTDQMPTLRESIREAEQTFEVRPGEELSFDVFNAVNKMAPHRTECNNPLQAEIVDRMIDSPEYNELHSIIMADEIAAGMAAASIITNVVAELGDDLKEQNKKAEDAKNDAADAQHEADALEQQLAEHGIDPDDDEAELTEAEAEMVDDAANAKAAAAKAQANAAAEMAKLEQVVADNGKAIGQAVAQGVGQANAQAQGVKAMAQAFGGRQAGCGTGDAGRMSVEDKMKMAELFKSNKAAFKKFADMLGRFMAASTEAEMSKNTGKAGSIVDITLGDDIANALTDDQLEVLSDDPAFATIGLLKMVDGGLMEYECDEDQPQHRGDVILLIDESSSMAGNRKQMADAFMLALAHHALKQGRKLRAINFQSKVTSNEVIDSSSKGLAALMRVAGRGTFGGTNFTEPVNTACDHADEMNKADVLMLTDGFAGLDAKVRERINGIRNTKGMRFYSLLIGGGNAAGCRDFSDKVFETTDLSNAVDIFKEV
jgi:uncharacterized protein with von Willebrand factor type A (vWA) domain